LAVERLIDRERLLMAAVEASCNGAVFEDIEVRKVSVRDVQGCQELLHSLVVDAHRGTDWRAIANSGSKSDRSRQQRPVPVGNCATTLSALLDGLDDDVLRCGSFVWGQPCFLKSGGAGGASQGGQQQWWHKDGRRSLILALQDETIVLVKVGGQAFKVTLQAGEGIVFGRDFVHAGAAHVKSNVRVHVYINERDEVHLGDATFGRHAPTALEEQGLLSEFALSEVGGNAGAGADANAAVAVAAPAPNSPAETDARLLWVACDACDRWRLLPLGTQEAGLPKIWLCHMHPDPAGADVAGCTEQAKKNTQAAWDL
jgi:hypothetical protein